MYYSFPQKILTLKLWITVLFVFAGFFAKTQNGTYTFVVHTLDCLNDTVPRVHVRLVQIPTPVNNPQPEGITLYNYSGISDSSGRVVFDSVSGALYRLKAFKSGYDSLIISNILINEDDSITINLLPHACPPREFYVYSSTSVATWQKPYTEIIPYESFEGDAFPPPGWQVIDGPGSGQHMSWSRHPYYDGHPFRINPGDEHFVWAGETLSGSGPPANTYLITPKIDLQAYDTARLSFDSYINLGNINYDHNFLEYSVDTGNTWIVFDTPPYNVGWVHYTVDLPDIDSTIWIAFHTNDTSYMSYENIWEIDHIAFSAGPADVQGYFIFLNNELKDYLPPDTLQYYYENLTYGQTYTGSIKAAYLCNVSDEVSYTWTSSFLYPPQNFFVDYVSGTDEAGLYWSPPALLLYDSTASNLIGYNIYLNDNFIRQVPYQGEPVNYQYLEIIDSLDLLWNFFKVSAVYDLTSYGFPGQTEESFSEPDSANVFYGYTLPFSENWDIPDFGEHLWEVSGTNGTWQMNTAEGNPPAAVSSSQDSLNYTYSIHLKSHPLNALEITEGNLVLQFDVKAVIDNSNNNNQNSLDVLITNEQTGSNYSAYYNQFTQSTDFITVSKNLESYFCLGKPFTVTFKAFGINYTSGNKIFIDNIKVFWDCAPKNLIGKYDWKTDSSGNIHFGALLYWRPPDLNTSSRAYEMDHFNIYRKTNNQEDYELYTTVDYYDSLVFYAYLDEYPNVSVNELYFYKVTSVLPSDSSGTYESLPAKSLYFPDQDYVYVYITGMQENKNPGSISVFPNPVKNKTNIKSNVPVKKVLIHTLSGKPVLNAHTTVKNRKNIELDLSETSAGVYLLSVITESGLKTVKVIKK